MTRPKAARLQHVAIEDSDVDRSIEWYRRMMGFKVTGRHPAHEVPEVPVELMFIRLASVHHEVVLVHKQAEACRSKPRPEHDLDGPVNFRHIAFVRGNREEWMRLLEHVLAEGADIVHGPVLLDHPRRRGPGTHDRLHLPVWPVWELEGRQRVPGR